ncbi:MAG: dCTP deaminase, partial [Flavisolibacter sp.]|nr:dCTP deaminase [Flavisolibacter sp.]
VLATYKNHILDAKQHNEIESFEIPKEGFILYPHIFYLGVTQEYTETHAHVPFLEGKSSTGRLGIDIHATAGKGDVGFCGNWTLEISVKQPVRIYAGMPVGQLIYFPVEGEIEVKYNQKSSAKYSGQPNRPVESMMWKNKF